MSCIELYFLNFVIFASESMNKTNSILPILRLIVIGFLFVSFVSSSFHIAAKARTYTSSHQSKKLKGPEHADSQFPLEDYEHELEKRWEERDGVHPFITDPFNELFEPRTNAYLLILDRRSELLHKGIHIIPLYLVNCTFRI